MILTWTSRENSLELIELSSINKVSLVQVSSCSNTGSIRDKLIELSSINKVSLVQVSSCSNTGSIRDDPYLDLKGEQFRTDRAIQYK
jgi:hypothetical protein